MYTIDTIGLIYAPIDKLGLLYALIAFKENTL